MSKESVKRVEEYIARRKKSRGIDIEHVHGFDVGPDCGVELLLSDIEAIISSAAPQVVADEREALEDLRTAVRDGVSDEWLLGFIRQIPLAAAPVQAQEPVACKTCGGAGIVSDGEIDHYPDGTPYMHGPVECVKECPDCAKPVAPVQPVAVPDGLRDAALESAVQAVAERAGESEKIDVINAFDAIRSLKKNRHALPESCSSFAAPAVQGDAKEPNMLWDAEDIEGTFTNSADEFAVNYASDNMIRGDVSMVEILRAVQIENCTMRIEVTDDEENPVKWEWADAAIAAKAAS